MFPIPLLTELQASTLYNVIPLLTELQCLCTFELSQLPYSTPTAKWAALRAILVLGAFEDMEIESVDISSAFLHADADTDIYLDHPEGFPQGPKNSVLKLLKNIYGLKQGNRSWYQLLDKLLIELEFKKVRCNHSVWVYEKDGIKVIVPVYVLEYRIQTLQNFSNCA